MPIPIIKIGVWQAVQGINRLEGWMLTLLAQSVEAGTDDAEIFGTGKGAEAVRNFLFHLGHANGALANVVGER